MAPARRSEPRGDLAGRPASPMETRQTDEFSRWLKGLRDNRASARIAARIVRIEAGNLGEVRSLGGGASECKIDYGPGYRLYFTIRRQRLIVLLAGGDKRSQRRDVALARELAAALDTGK
ncbi:MAG: type II toxin-antitoxin system RelE/ParE family toxin [Allosphingosinicella sp.]